MTLNPIKATSLIICLFHSRFVNNGHNVSRAAAVWDW